MPKKTALYCRVSTGNQSTGLEAQVRALREYCNRILWAKPPVMFRMNGSPKIARRTGEVRTTLDIQEL